MHFFSLPAIDCRVLKLFRGHTEFKVVRPESRVADRKPLDDSRILSIHPLSLQLPSRDRSRFVAPLRARLQMKPASLRAPRRTARRRSPAVLRLMALLVFTAALAVIAGWIWLSSLHSHGADRSVFVVGAALSRSAPAMAVSMPPEHQSPSHPSSVRASQGPTHEVPSGWSIKASSNFSLRDGSSRR